MVWVICVDWVVRVVKVIRVVRVDWVAKGKKRLLDANNKKTNYTHFLTMPQAADNKRLVKMYDTSPESWAHEAAYRLFFISIAFIYCEYKAKSKMAIGAKEK